MSETENPSPQLNPSDGQVPAGAPVPPPPSAPSAGAPIPPPPSAPSAGAPIPPPPSAPSAGAPIPPPMGYFPPQAGAPAPGATMPYPAQPAPAPYPYPNPQATPSPQVPQVAPNAQGMPVPPPGVAPYPTAPYAAQPSAGYQPGQMAPYPGQPMPPGQPAAPGQSDISAAFANSLQTLDIKSEFGALWQVISNFFRAYPVKALEVAQNSRYVGVLVIALGSLFSALLVASLQSSTFSGAVQLGTSFFDQITGSRSNYHVGMPWGAWFSTFFTVLFTVAITLLLRVLVTFLTMRLHKAPVSFKNALNVVATAFAPFYFVLAIVWVLSLLPSFAWIAVLMSLASLAFIWLLFAGELMVYLGIGRAAHYQRSPLLTHATFTALWGLVTMILFFTLIAPSISNIFSF